MVRLSSQSIGRHADLSRTDVCPSGTLMGKVVSVSRRPWKTNFSFLAPHASMQLEIDTFSYKYFILQNLLDASEKNERTAANNKTVIIIIIIITALTNQLKSCRCPSSVTPVFFGGRLNALRTKIGWHSVNSLWLCVAPASGELRQQMCHHDIGWQSHAGTCWRARRLRDSNRRHSPVPRQLAKQSCSGSVGFHQRIQLHLRLRRGRRHARYLSFWSPRLLKHLDG